jgi:hypothetical protein
MAKSPAFETNLIHAGQKPDPTERSRGVAIHRTSSFVFNSAKQAADLFGLRELGNIYTRLGDHRNPGRPDHCPGRRSRFGGSGLGHGGHLQYRHHHRQTR